MIVLINSQHSQHIKKVINSYSNKINNDFAITNNIN